MENKVNAIKNISTKIAPNIFVLSDKYFTYNALNNNISSVSMSPPPTYTDNNYRFYHCYEDVIGLKCKKVSGPDVLPAHQNTKLLFVRNYIPERLDVHILKYKWMPSSVHIE
jgi:hypothetical protein